MSLWDAIILKLMMMVDIIVKLVAMNVFIVMLVEPKVIQPGKNKGQNVDSVISYHATLENALKDYKRVMINTSDATSIKELLEKVAEIDKTIKKVLGGI